MSTDPFRRVRQHNAEIVGGAKATKRWKDWSILCIIYGFSSKKQALRFEWFWKHNTNRSIVRGFQRRFQRAKTLLSQSEFQTLKLEIVEKNIAVTWSWIEQGKRSTLEDRVISISGLDQYSLFGICDGHGGADTAAFVADQFPLQFLVQLLNSNSNTDQALHLTYRRIHKQVKEQGWKCGTTCVVAWFDNQQKLLWLANTGDSRAVLFCGNTITTTTKDHKPTGQERKRVQAAGGTVYNQRVQGQLAVSRSIGDIEFTKYGVIPDPDIYGPISTDGPDYGLVIASDGIWDVFSDQELVNLICKLKTKGMSFTEIAKEIVRQAISDHGSTDNCSVIVIDASQAAHVEKKEPAQSLSVSFPDLFIPFHWTLREFALAQRRVNTIHKDHDFKAMIEKKQLFFGNYHVHSTCACCHLYGDMAVEQYYVVIPGLDTKQQKTEIAFYYCPNNVVCLSIIRYLLAYFIRYGLASYIPKFDSQTIEYVLAINEDDMQKPILLNPRNKKQDLNWYPLSWIKFHKDPTPYIYCSSTQNHIQTSKLVSISNLQHLKTLPKLLLPKYLLDVEEQNKLSK